MFGSFGPDNMRPALGSSMSRSKNNSFGADAGVAGEGYKPNFQPNFGSSFGSNFRSNNFSSGRPQQNMMSMFSNQMPSPVQQDRPMMPQQMPQQPMRAMAPSMGMGGFMRPQAGMGNILQNTEGGQDINLSQNRMPPGLSGLMDRFRGRIQL